jgi:LysR family transcriptional regulator, mexEF-oprN operon transcriptional activator
MLMSNVDLNLLLVFDAVMAERNVRRAAERLGRSQPAVSQSIARLRDLLTDQLFRRTPTGVDPTPRAEAIWAAVREPLAKLRAELAPNDFDPARAQGEVRIGMSDDVHLIAFPDIVSSIRAQAPNLLLRVTEVDHQSVWASVTSGLVDAAVTVAGQPPRGLAGKVIGRQRFVVVRRSDTAAPLSLDDYLARDHVAVSFSADQPGFTDQRLAALGRERRIIATTPHFAAILDLVIRTGAVATMPEAIARVYGRFGAVSLSPCPFELPEVPVMLCWHLRRQVDPQNAWLRAKMVEVLAGFYAGPTEDVGPMG